MKRLLFPVCAIVAMLSLSGGAQAQNRAQYESLVASHARANMVPEALVHRVIVRESKYHPDLIGRGGTIGLMQIKLATARGVGYTGDAAGLRDPDTNLAYGVKYLAGAWRAANGDHNRAMHYYASGYYYAAKQQRLERAQPPVLASAPPQDVALPKQAAAKPKTSSNKLADAKAQVPRPPAAVSGGANAPKPR
jgi:soluble lytic murein transglycosylase-like protein